VSPRASTPGEQLELTAEGERPKRKRRAATDTSVAAAARAERTAAGLRDRIYAAILEAARDPRRDGATADEVHETIAATETERLDVRRLMNVRRRVSELHNEQRIQPTMIRRVNAQGSPVIVWTPVMLCPQGEASNGAR
jgi:hypothetical protein